MDDSMNVLLDGCMTGLMNICMHRGGMTRWMTGWKTG